MYVRCVQGEWTILDCAAHTSTKGCAVQFKSPNVQGGSLLPARFAAADVRSYAQRKGNILYGHAPFCATRGEYKTVMVCYAHLNRCNIFECVSTKKYCHRFRCAYDTLRTFSPPLIPLRNRLKITMQIHEKSA